MGKTVRLVATMLLASQAHGAISALVSTTTQTPNGGGRFISLGAPSAYDSPFNIAVGLSFQAESDTGRRGIYSLAFPGAAAVADTSMLMPGFNQSFGSFSSESGSFAPSFRGFGTDGVSTGVYTKPGGTILLIAQPGDVVDGQTIQSLGAVSAHQSSLVFETDFGIVRRVSGQNAAMVTSASSGLHSFRDTDFATPAFLGFRANDSKDVEGIYYTTSAANLSKVADLFTSIPGGTGNFTGFGKPNVSPTLEVFRGTGSGQDGIYKVSAAGASLSRVVDLDTPVPNAPGVHFATFADPVASDVDTSQYPGTSHLAAQIVFVATLTDGREGIYMALDGQIGKLYDTTDVLNGQHPAHFEIGPDSYANTILAFKVTFADGSQALYEDQPFVPEPAGFSLVWVGTTAILMRRRGLPT